MSANPRDFAGYGPTPPDLTWPNGARLAVNLVVNYEEGAERSPLDGDTVHEHLVEATYDVPGDERNLFTESTFEYGSRVGIWRLLDAFDDRGITPTFFASALALERNPRVARELAERDCDIVGHGYRWIPHTGMTEEAERRNIEDCLASLRRTTGKPVTGWFTRPPNTVRTRRLLAEAGLRYDAGSVSDDLPYYDHLDTGPFLVVPYSLDVNDTKYYKGGFFTAEDFTRYALDTFEVLRGESRRHLRMMSIGLHPRIIGRPGRMAGLHRILDHLANRTDVWLARRDDIAEHWRAHVPPD